jgi:hypothetical protein
MNRFVNADDFRFRAETRADLYRLRNQSLPANPVTAFTVTPNASSWGATINYTLGPSLTGCSSVRLMRNSIKDLSSAIVLDTKPLTAEDANTSFQFVDLDKSLLSDTFYWVQTIPLPDRAGTAQDQIVTNSPIVSGPLSLTALNASLLPPDPISDFSASLGAVQGVSPNQFQTVYVNFLKPQDPSFASVQIQATNYLADTNSVAVAQSAYGPFSFNLEKTGETITLSAFSISQNGVPATSAPSLTLTLNGAETVPAKLENVRATAIIDGIQVDFDAGLEPDITQYKVFRGPHGGGFGAATIKQTITSTGVNHYTYLDTTGLTVPAFDYFVTAVNGVGSSAASAAVSANVPPQNMDQIGQGSTYQKVPQYTGRNVIVANANFEASASILPPPGWINPQSLTLSYETSSPGGGLRSLKITNCPQNGGVFSEQKWPVTPGDSYYVQAAMKGDGVSNTFAELLFTDKNGTFLSAIQASGGAPTSTSWNVYENSGTAPANSVTAQIALGQSAVSSSSCWFDDIFVSRQSSMDNELVDGATFRRLKYVDANNTISVSTALNGQGSIVPGQAITVTVTFGPTTAALTWSSQSILRADGSVLTLVASSGGGIAYSSLSASTKYYVYLRISTTTGIMTDVGGSPVTSPNTTRAIDAALDGGIPVPVLSFTTQAAGGGGGGSGSGGGGDTCPWEKEPVEIKRLDQNGKILFEGVLTAGEVQVFDFLKGYCFIEKRDVYRQVRSVRRSHISAWYIVNGHKVSPTEPIWDGQNWIPAYRHPGAVFDGSVGVRIDISVADDDYNACNYWLVGDDPLLIHNTFVLPC